jgi:hypothetical protein
MMTTDRTGIRIIILGSGGDVVEKRTLVHEIFAVVMAMVLQAREV